jgi:hypothetical protein
MRGIGTTVLKLSRRYLAALLDIFDASRKRKPIYSLLPILRRDAHGY